MHHLLQRQKMIILSKETTVDTINLKLGDILHLDLAFYNVTSIQDFTTIFYAVCYKTRMLWI